MVFIHPRLRLPPLSYPILITQASLLLRVRWLPQTQSSSWPRNVHQRRLRIPNPALFTWEDFPSVMDQKTLGYSIAALYDRPDAQTAVVDAYRSLEEALQRANGTQRSAEV